MQRRKLISDVGIQDLVSRPGDRSAGEITSFLTTTDRKIVLIPADTPPLLCSSPI